MVDSMVSICVPTFEGGRWLRACLESAQAQTFTDVEILVVDDGSEDDSAAIAAEFAARDPRVVVSKNERRLGLAANWNRCVELARGTWIKFLFQDDVLAPTCVERMVVAGESGEEHAMLVVSDRHVEIDAGMADRIRDYFAALPKMDDLFGKGETIPTEVVCRAIAAHPGVNFFGEPSAVLVHRDAFARFGRFNTSMIQLCDLEFAARVGSSVGLRRVRDELATFRIHEHAASAANDAARAFRKDVLDTLILYHEFAFGGEFETLRRVARESRPPVSFSKLAARELQRAQRDVRNSEDPELGRGLREVLDAHPKLGRPLWQLWHRVRKQLKR